MESHSKAGRADLGMGLVFIVLNVALLIAAIGSARAGEVLPVAKVRGIYVEAARGVLVEQRFALGVRGRQVADVELQGQQRAIVQLPAELKVNVGDLVEVSLAQPEPAPLGRRQASAPVAGTSRATLVVAKWFMPQARAFGTDVVIASKSEAAELQ